MVVRNWQHWRTNEDQNILGYLKKRSWSDILSSMKYQQYTRLNIWLLLDSGYDRMEDNANLKF